MPDFRALFRYTDLRPARKKLYRRIEHMTALYVLRSKVISPRNYGIKEEVMKDILSEKVAKKKEARPEDEKQREEDEKMQSIAKMLKKVDKNMIKVWDLELMFFICNVQVSITGNKTDPNTSNQAMFDFGISN